MTPDLTLDSWTSQRPFRLSEIIQNPNHWKLLISCSRRKTIMRVFCDILLPPDFNFCSVSLSRSSSFHFFPPVSFHIHWHGRYWKTLAHRSFRWLLSHYKCASVSSCEISPLGAVKKMVPRHWVFRQWHKSKNVQYNTIFCIGLISLYEILISFITLVSSRRTLIRARAWRRWGHSSRLEAVQSPLEEMASLETSEHGQ